MHYAVNVGNIGNIECKTRVEANKTYAMYVSSSKGLRYSSAQQEDVCLMVKGEPVKEFIFSAWKVGKLRKMYDRKQQIADIARQELEEYKLLVGDFE